MSNIKIVFVGEAEAGKTSLLKRVICNTFSSAISNQTFCLSKIIDGMGQRKIKGMIWVVSSKQSTPESRSAYYKNADIIAICVDINKSPKEIYQEVEKYIDEIDQHCPTAKVVIMATQLDRIKEKVNDEFTARKECLKGLHEKSQGRIANVFFTSAKAGMSIILSSPQQPEQSFLAGLWEIAKSIDKKKTDPANLTASTILDEFKDQEMTKDEFKECLEQYKYNRKGWGCCFWRYGSRSIKQLNNLYTNLENGQSIKGSQILAQLSEHRKKTLQTFACQYVRSNGQFTPQKANDGTNFVVQKIFCTMKEASKISPALVK